MRRFGVALLCIVFALACTPADERVAAPNIVLVIGDDHGFRDFGFMGSEFVQTPNLDRLAAGGTVFPFGFTTASVCRPSLRSLLTGLHPIEFDRFEQHRIRQGVPASPATPLRELFATLPALLAGRGYASFQSGKYQEGDFTNAGFTHGMTRAAGKAGRKQGIRIARETMEPLFQFIDSHLEQPFFVWFAPQLPHLPHNPPKRFREPYEELGLPWFAPGYYASVSWFDDSLGQLVAHLEAQGIRDHTLIVYLADNGWQAPAEGVEYDFVLGGHQGKGSLYELGFRTPVIFNQAGVVAAGVRQDALVSAVDLFPTLLDYAGAEFPPNRSGRDLRPLIEGRTARQREVIIGTAAALRDDRSGQPRGGAFLQDARWHYQRHNDGRQALFDHEIDPEERNDVAPAHPEKVAEFQRRIRDWRQERTDAADRSAEEAAPW